MKVVSTEQMQEMDRLMTTEFGVSGDTLMDRAGFGVAEAVDELANMAGFSEGSVRLVAGKGNNGGDVYVAARYLKERGYEVEVLLAGTRGRIKGDALKHLEAMKHVGIRLEEVSSPDEWADLQEEARFHDGVVVDGVLGTGLRGPARGNAAGAIQYINAHRDRCPIVSVDVPSGLNSDTGKATGDVVTADLTVTMALPTTGLLNPEALPYIGAVDVVDIGFADTLVARYDSPLTFISADDCRRLLVPRKRADHKGSFGHLLLIGGADGYAGAMILATRAALRSGVGLVTVLVPQAIRDIVASAVPEAMVHGATATREGCFSKDAIAAWPHNASNFNAVVVGPGLTAGDDMASVLETVFTDARGPVLIDADGLNVLAAHPDLRKKITGDVVMTPHPGEMSRLMSQFVADLQADRLSCAEAAAKQWNATVVHKGAGTVVAAPDAVSAVNLTGNPGMARGGMGDALAGIIGALAAQGMSPGAAARVGTYIHGRAGDRVAWSSSQAGMITSDLIEELPAAFAELSPR